MARSPANGEGSVTEQTTLIFPKKSALESLLETKRQSKKRSQSAAGSYSKAQTEAVEHEHVSRFAFRHAAAFADLDDEKLHVEMFHFIDYVKKLGVMKRAMSTEDMFEDRKIDATALDGVQKPKGKRAKKGIAGDELPDNVTSIGAAARNVAEQAGGAA